MMRLWIAAVLLLLFACQALPVTALGKACVKLQQSCKAASGSDDAGNCDSDPGIPGNDDADSDAPDIDLKVKKQEPLLDGCAATSFILAAWACSDQASCAIFHHRRDHLPVYQHGEVLTPPPDCC